MTDAILFRGRPAPLVDPSALWLGWEADPPRISQEECRTEVEPLCAALLALPEADRHRAVRSSSYRKAALVEILLEKSSRAQEADPGQAKDLARLAGALATQLLKPSEDSSGAAVFYSRAFYLAGNAWRLLGDDAEAEIAFAAAPYHFGDSFGSLDRAFYCRALALLRWGQGRLEEAKALFLRAAHRFRETGQREELGTTLALLGLQDLEEGHESRRHGLMAAWYLMPINRRPWLIVRVALSLALRLASQEKSDAALAMLQEVWRLAPKVAAPQEQVCMRWWEGRVMARLGDEADAARLLATARKSYLEQRLVPEAGLASLDAMLFLAETGRGAEARQVAEELVVRLGGENGGDIAVAAVRDFQSDIESGRSDLRAEALARASTLRRILRYRGFRIDPLPFA